MGIKPRQISITYLTAAEIEQFIKAIYNASKSPYLFLYRLRPAIFVSECVTMSIFCIEHNYYLHKGEQPFPAEPSIFVKPDSALLATGAAFSFPEFANELYCGCELVLRVSENGEKIKAKMASRYYDCISVGINFTALSKSDDLNDDEWPWEKAKAWDNSSATGSFLAAGDFGSKNDINFCLYKNRVLQQLGNSGFMINSFDTIISIISNSFALHKGDLVFTGTPAGIGQLAPGDKLEAFIEDDSLLEFDVA